ncbi:hypothetical protein BOX15_Mlig030651g2 [Macrostomum lignano]|uniref:Uncharacterized protein n=1 Tax=Macrostomum lignano TaxID=282301 RepID=A0A267GAF4_9PLAT|nr:hypothetical protein BOX15_Mlig030651g2 [Macrostomum lignano]
MSEFHNATELTATTAAADLYPHHDSPQSIFPLKRNQQPFGLNRLDSETSSSSGGSGGSAGFQDILSPSSSGSDVVLTDLGSDHMEDNLDFLFADMPPLPPPSQHQQESPPPSSSVAGLAEHASSVHVEPPVAVLDCFQDGESTCNRQQKKLSSRSPTAPVVSKKSTYRRGCQKRTRPVCHIRSPMPAATVSSKPRLEPQAAQAVLCQVNGLLESANRLGSETSLLRLHAARLVDEVLASRRRLLVVHENKSK